MYWLKSCEVGKILVKEYNELFNVGGILTEKTRMCCSGPMLTAETEIIFKEQIKIDWILFILKMGLTFQTDLEYKVK